MLLSHRATTAPSVPEMQLELLSVLSFDLSEGILWSKSAVEDTGS